MVIQPTNRSYLLIANTTDELGKLKEQCVTEDLRKRVQEIKKHRIKEHPEKEGW